MSAATTTVDGAEDSVMQSVADAMNDAAATAQGHAEKVRAAVGNVGPQVANSLSRAGYTGAYVLAYGVTYAAVFVACSLPQNNPIMHGFRDGGAAAVEAVKAR